MVVAPEVIEVERENARDLVNHHSRGDGCIMNANTGNAVLKHESTPGGEDLRSFWQESHERLK